MPASKFLSSVFGKLKNFFGGGGGGGGETSAGIGGGDIGIEDDLDLGTFETDESEEDIYDVLDRAGQEIVATANSLAPEHISGHIQYRIVEGRYGSTPGLRIFIDLDDAPDARAQELGSGVHATVGTAEEYMIRPKDADVLAFIWENNPDPELYTEDEGGYVHFPYVTHPGIEAWPYLKPAIRQYLKRNLQHDINVAMGFE